jgi:hypothetical protein
VGQRRAAPCPHRRKVGAAPPGAVRRRPGELRQRSHPCVRWNCEEVVGPSAQRMM